LSNIIIINSVNYIKNTSIYVCILDLNHFDEILMYFLSIHMCRLNITSRPRNVDNLKLRRRCSVKIFRCIYTNCQKSSINCRIRS